MNMSVADTWSDPEICKRNREAAEKLWAEWDKALEEKQKENAQIWIDTNKEWLARLLESHERMDSMAAYCKRLERRVAVIESFMLKLHQFNEMLEMTPHIKARFSHIDLTE